LSSTLQQEFLATGKRNCNCCFQTRVPVSRNKWNTAASPWQNRLQCAVGIPFQTVYSVQQEGANWNAGTKTTLHNDL